MSIMLDFTVLEKYANPVVVQCLTSEDAEVFVGEMLKCFPQKTMNWADGDTHWDFYEKHTCYAPHIYDKKHRFMEYSPDYYWRSAGYTVVPFHELIHSQDLGEFEMNDPIALKLFGL